MKSLRNVLLVAALAVGSGGCAMGPALGWTNDLIIKQPTAVNQPATTNTREQNRK